MVAKADLALADGNVDGLAKAIATHTEEGIRKRFEHALEARKHAHESVEAEATSPMLIMLKGLQMPSMALPNIQKLELPDRISTDRYDLAAGDK